MDRNQLPKPLPMPFLFILLVVTLLIVNTTRPAYAGSALSDDSGQTGCTREWYDPFAVAASVLEMAYWDLQDALATGLSIADVASERNVAVEQIVDALIDTETRLVRKMERGGCLSSAEAEAWIAGLPEQMWTFVEAVEAATSPSVVYLPILMN